MLVFEDNTDNVIDKIERQERLALALAATQIVSEVQMIRPPQVQTGFFRATLHTSGESLNITGEGDKRQATKSGKPEAYQSQKYVNAIDVIAGADYAIWLEFKPFSHVGVLAPIRKGAANAIPIITKIFTKYLTF
jgi:hypothetical protein